MAKPIRALTLGATLLITATAGSPHHSVAMFDQTKKVMIQGTVVEFQWTNPHVWLQIKAPDSKGALVEQGFEIGAPNTLIRDGFRKSSFMAGDKVSVLASPRRDGTVGGLYLCGRTATGKWLAFGMGPNSKPPTECKD
jgi:Family of unknown function (DUF6152)